MLVLMVKQFTLDHTSLVRVLLGLEHLVTLLLNLMILISWRLVDGECARSLTYR